MRARKTSRFTHRVSLSDIFANLRRVVTSQAGVMEVASGRGQSVVKVESEPWETILGLLNSIQPIKIEPPRLRSSSPAALAGQVCLSRACIYTQASIECLVLPCNISSNRALCPPCDCCPTVLLASNTCDKGIMITSLLNYMYSANTSQSTAVVNVCFHSHRQVARYRSSIRNWHT